MWRRTLDASRGISHKETAPMSATRRRQCSSVLCWRCSIQMRNVTACLSVQKWNSKLNFHQPHSGINIQLILNKTIIHSRRCDSRNLNLSPLCSFSSTAGPVYWKQEITKVYRKAGEIPEYIRKMEGATRNYYANKFRKKREVITSLVEVKMNLL